MTVEEAVQLVIQAGAIGDNGNVLVLDMGQPVRIADVARRLAETVQPPCEIRYTGLRPGEKLVETLFGSDETPQPTTHPLVTKVHGHALDPAELDALWRPEVPPRTAMALCLARIGLDDEAQIVRS